MLQITNPSIQVRRQLKARVLAKQGSQHMHNTIPKSKEWLIVNCVVNATRTSLLGFYIFRRERIHNDYIQLCIPNICMAMQSKTWMTTFLFKEFLFFFKKLTPSGISINNKHLLILDG
jgi:hypothetical protein